MVKKGEWVQIHQIVLNPENRADHLPEDTKKVPLELWVKGFLKEDSNMGDEVEIETIIGRETKGTLVAVNPKYEYDFGDCVPELLKVGIQLRGILKEGEANE